MNEKITLKIFKRLIEKFGLKIGDADYTGPGVPDEGDAARGIYRRRSKIKKRRGAV